VLARADVPNSYEYAVALSELGRVRLTFNQYKAADTLLTTALLCFEQQGVTADSAYLKTCANAANNCRSLAEFARTEQILQRGLLAADASKGTPHEAYRIDLLLQYAYLDNELSRFQQAREHYEQALAVVEKFFGDKSPKVASVLTEWGGFENGTMSDNKTADLLLTRALKILIPIAKRYPAEYLAATTTQARLYAWGMPRYRESQQMLEKAVIFGEKNLGPQHTYLAWMLRVLANTYMNKTPYFYKADTLNQRALAIYKHHFGKHYGAYVGTLQDISEWHESLGYDQKANEIRRTAFDLIRTIYGDRHPETANLMLAFAKTQKNAGYPLQADSLLRVVDSLYLSFYGYVHTSRITILCTQASFASSRQSYSAADSLYRRALAEEERLNGKESTNWWSIIRDIATQNWASDRPDQADSLYRTKMFFDEKKYGPNSLAYAFDWLNLFYVYNSGASNKPLDAERAIRKYLSITESAVGKENAYYLMGFNWLTSSLLKQRRFGDAEKTIEERAHIVLKIYGEQSTNWIDILDDKIDLVIKTSTPSASIPLRRQVLKARQALGDHEGYLRALSRLASELSQLGLYTEGDSLTQELLNTTRKQHGKASGNYLFALSNAFILYSRTGEYQKMKTCLDSAILVDKVLGHPYESLIQKWQANYYYGIGDYKTAAQLWLKELEQDPDAGNHNKYGEMLYELGQYARADSILHVGLSKVDNNPELEISLYLNLFNNLHHWGNPTKDTTEYIEKALALAEKTYGKNHPDYAIVLNSYAMALGKLGRYKEEEDAYKKVLKIQDNNPTDKATTLTNMGLMYYMLGREETAENLTLEALKLRENKLGLDHPDCISSKHRLADYYISGFNKPFQADSLITLVTAYWKVRARQSRQYADALLLRGKFLTYTCEFELAEKYIRDARAIFELAIEPQCWEVGNCLNELGLTYNEAARNIQGKAKADLLRLSLDNVKASMHHEANQYGTNRINYATHLSNIAACYYQMGYADSVIHYQLRSIALRKVLQGDNNHHSGSSYSSLAGAYEMLGQYSKAEEETRKALKILAETTGKESEDYIPCAAGMGRILLAIGKKEEAYTYFEEERKAVRAKIRKGFGYLSNAEQIKIAHRYRPDYYYALSLDYGFPELARFGYNDALLFKGAGLRNSRTLRNILSASTDSTELQRYDEYLMAEKTIAAEYQRPKDQRTRLDSLKTAAHDLERDLIARSPDYRSYVEHLEVNWQAVQANLQPNEAAIEFVRYNRKRVIDTDTFLYAALVLRPDMEAPIFVHLCSELELKNKLFNKEVDIARTDAWASSLYRPEISVRAQRETGKSLYDLLWQPLNSKLKGTKTIFFSPDGLLHQISFAALGYADKKEQKIFIRDSFNLVQVASTRQVLSSRTKSTLAAGDEVFVVGNIDYGPSNGIASNKAVLTTCVSDKLSDLEFGEACTQYKRYGQKVTTLTDKGATEQKVVAILNRQKPFRAISLMTHGLFLPSANKCGNLAHLYSEANPMQRSCLIFAGFNAVDTIHTYVDDCILTAQDFAGMNLKGTELVIVSACQSGLGDVLHSEGVFGLQRAFKEAGVRYLIISLWDLPDYSTSVFMQEFYKLWLEKGNNVPEAFRAAQQIMRDRNSDVEKWGGLILIE
jgi:tetratricopeptide (TPR) repeat protein